MALHSGQVLKDRYQIVAQLGQGGYGTVYRAWDLKMNAPCALKENLDLSPNSQGRFSQEAQLLFQLRHAGLPRVYDYFSLPDSGQFMVMDYIPGEDGQVILARTGQPLQTAQAVNWLCQVCDALSYLHSQQPPIFHRDIKPSNIKITPSGQAVLVDFGIARRYDPTQQVTQAARPVTPGYSPPEQYGPSPTDERSDIYSLGATAYTLLTNRIPPSAADLTAGKASLPDPAQVINPAVPTQLSMAVMKAMQLNWANRFTNAQAFKAALSGQVEKTTSPLSSGAGAAPGIPGKKALNLLTRKWWLWLVILMTAGICMLSALALPKVWGFNVGELWNIPVLGRIISPNPGSEQAGLSESTRNSEAALSLITAENAQSLKTIGRRGKGYVRSVAWTPDGKKLFFGATTGIYIYDAKNLREIKRIETGANNNEVAISPSGKVMAVALDSKSLELWDLNTERRFLTEPAVSTWSWVLAFSPDSRLLAYIDDQKIKVLNIKDQSVVQSFSIATDLVSELAFSADNNELAAAYTNGMVQVFNLLDGSTLFSRPGKSEEEREGSYYIGAIAFSPDGSLFATGTGEKVIELRNPSDHSLVRSLAGHNDVVTRVAFSPDGKTLISASYYDKTIRWWNIQDGSLLYTLEQEFPMVPQPILSPDGKKILITGIENQTRRAFGSAIGDVMQSKESDFKYSFTFSISPDGYSIAVPDQRGVHVYNLVDGNEIKVIECKPDELDDYTSAISVSHSPDGRLLACIIGGKDTGIIQVWDTLQWKLVQEFKDDMGYPVAAFSQDNSKLASGNSMGILRMWDIQNGGQIQSLEGHAEGILDLIFSTDGARLISVSEEGTFRYWDTHGLSLIQTIENEEWINAHTFSRDQNLMASGNYKGQIWLRRMVDGELIHNILGEPLYISTITISPDGQLLASGSYKNDAINIWRISDGVLIASIASQQGGVNKLAFSPDGRKLISGGYDGTIQIWGVEN